MIAAPSPTDGELREALERILGPSIRIERIERRPSPYRTSFPIEELKVDRQGGPSLAIIWKDLSRSSLSEAARGAKPAFLYDPLREIEVYESLLPAARLGTPVCYGTGVDESLRRYWLFIEHVTGRELYQIGDFEIWREAAAWLARLHAHYFVDFARVRGASHLVDCDEAFYRLWIERAIAFAHDGTARARLNWLAKRYDAIVERLLGLPTTLLHGEFYPSNVLVADLPCERRICPVDWEMAARGPGLIDLAALTAGNWDDDQRTALAQAYRDTWQAHGLPIDAPQDFGMALDCCRIHLAVQWLGWSSEWAPPPEHRHNWLGEALRLAERLSLDRVP
jgi:hypothetical protein